MVPQKFKTETLREPHKKCAELRRPSQETMIKLFDRRTLSLHGNHALIRPSGCTRTYFTLSIISSQFLNSCQYMYYVLDKGRVSLGNLILRLSWYILFIEAKYIFHYSVEFFFQQCNLGKDDMHGLEYIKPGMIHNSCIALHFLCQCLISIWIDRH